MEVRSTQHRAQKMLGPLHMRWPHIVGDVHKWDQPTPTRGHGFWQAHEHTHRCTHTYATLPPPSDHWGGIT